MKFGILNKLRKLKNIPSVWKLFNQAPDFADNGKKNILILIYSLQRGGAERVASILASSLAQEYNVTMVCCKKVKTAYSVDPRVDVLYLPSVLTGIKLWSGKEFLKAIKGKRKIDCSISLLRFMNTINVKSKGRDFVVVSERNDPRHYSPKMNAEAARAYSGADHVVFQSKTVQSLYGPSVVSHSSVLPNPVSVACGAAAQSAHRIVNVARLVPQKNQKLLIRAFAGFLPAHPGYTLDIYGEGPCLDELRELCSGLKIERAVSFHGNVENIHEQIRDAEMFVLSSDFEGLSNALLEAMMMGLPCISTRCNGSVDVIESGRNGLLVDINEEGQMLDAITRLAEDPRLRKQLAEEAKVTGSAFRKDAVIRQWTGLIEKGIREKKSVQ